MRLIQDIKHSHTISTTRLVAYMLAVHATVFLVTLGICRLLTYLR